MAKDNKEEPVAEATVAHDPYTGEVVARGNMPVVPMKEEGRYDDDTLRSITSFKDLEQRGEVLVDAESVLGTGWERVDDDVAAKASLCDVSLAIVEWQFSVGEYYDEKGELGKFVTMFILTEDGKRFIITDGSTGIARELWNFSYSPAGDQLRPLRNLYLKKGFRESPYFIDARTKKPVPRGFQGPKEPASTFYLNV